MSLTVAEADAVLALTRWLAHTPHPCGDQVTDTEAIEAMELLADHAGHAIQISPDRTLPARIVERLQAADSDGAAQTLARAVDQARYVPAPLRKPLETWRRLQDTELGERLRDQTAVVVGDHIWGEVDV